MFIKNFTTKATPGLSFLPPRSEISATLVLEKSITSGVLIMTLIFQIVLSFFVLYSFLMVIAVPVAYASPSNWNQTRPLILVGSVIWLLLVIVVAILNSFVI